MTLTEQDLTALRALRRRVRALNFADRALFPIW